MRNIAEIIKKRYSVRKYLAKPVEKNKIIKCIEAARLAPSAENIQPWRFLVINKPEKLIQLKKAAFSGIYSFTKWANSAPVIIVILAKPNFLTNKIGAQIQDIEYYLIDIGISVEHLILQASELKLGTCWIGWYNKKAVAKVLKIPKKYKLICLLTLGYFEYNNKLNRKIRKPIDKIVFFNNIN